MAEQAKVSASPSALGASSQRRLLYGVDRTRVDLGRHLAMHGPPPRSVEIAAVERAQLLGRGGAAFPAATKMRAVASAGGRTVVANGAEGEPASLKDKTALTYVPHLVIDGAVAAARAVGAIDVIICVSRSAHAAIASIQTALLERKRLDQGIRIWLERVPDRYVAGEESALVHWLNRGPAKPTLVPPRPFQKGVGGKPTLVQNVETLAAIALVARYGSDWYRKVGDGNEPGTRLVTVSGAVASPGVYEVPCGLSPAAVVEAAGGATQPIQAFLFGGYFGSWMPASQAWKIPLTEAAIRGARGSLGCGVIVALPAEACGVVELARVARYLSDETAGQCGPCVHGLDSIATEVEALASGAGGNLDRVSRWIDQVQGRGACHHPDGALRFIASGLRVFGDDVDRHRRRQPCRARGRKPVLPIPMGQDGWR